MTFTTRFLRCKRSRSCLHSIICSYSPKPPGKIMADLKGRIVVQQCLSASLRLPVQVEDECPKILKIERGMVVFICFLSSADEETVNKLIKHVISVRLSENDDGKRVCISDVGGDILVIPQATLGGRLKGKSMQYHGNVEKNFGKELYGKFCEGLKTALECRKECNVECGEYGARQVLNMDTNGPFTHIIEI